MTTNAQVWHIAKKDLTQFRVWILAYLAVIACSTMIALDLVDSTSSSWPAMLAPLCWLLGGLTIALIVQADAPAEPRAYWASLPIASRALLHSKSAVVVGVLFIPPLIGQLLSIRHYELSAARTGAMMAGTAVVYGAWLLLAMVVASMTKRLAPFLGILIGIPAAFSFLRIFVAGPSWRARGSYPSADVIGLLTLLVATSMLVLVYRRRQAGNRWLSLGALVVAGGLFALTAPPTYAVSKPISSMNLPLVHTELAPVDLRSLESYEEQALNFNATGMTPGYQYALLVDSVFATWELEGSRPQTSSVFRAQSPIIFGGSSRSELVGAIFVGDRSGAAEGVIRIVRSLRVAGQIEALSSTLLATFPATGHAELLDGETHLSVNGINPARAGASISFLRAQSTIASRPRFASERRYTLRLVWPNRADTLQVSLNSSTNISRSLVLPGASINQFTFRHMTEGSTLLERLPAPLDSAKLQLLRWTPVARYPITMERAFH